MGKSRFLPLWQEILLTLLLKGLLLTLIWYVWFSSPEDRTLDEQKVASQLFSSQPLKEPAHGAIPGPR